jgi:hypothetical protein
MCLTKLPITFCPPIWQSRQAPVLYLLATTPFPYPHPTTLQVLYGLCVFRKALVGEHRGSIDVALLINIMLLFFFFFASSHFFRVGRPRIFQRRMQALMCALPRVVSAAASSTIWRDEQARIGQLPGSLRCSLHLLHTKDAARPGGKKPEHSFSAYEDDPPLAARARRRASTICTAPAASQAWRGEEPVESAEEVPTAIGTERAAHAGTDDFA